MPEAASKPVTVLSAGAVEFVITDLGGRFTRDTGIPVKFTFGTIAGVRKRLQAGETADMVIGTTSALAEMEQTGILIAGTRSEIGSTETGFCVRAGAPVPDISTPEKFRAALLAARSFAYTDPNVGGTSGIYLRALMERFGIRDAVDAKSVMCINGEDVVTRVASGEAEIGSTFVSEFFLADGITSVGALPASIGNATSYSAALLAAAGNRDAAGRFLAMINAPAQRPTWIAGGFKPAM